MYWSIIELESGNIECIRRIMTIGETNSVPDCEVKHIVLYIEAYPTKEYSSGDFITKIQGSYCIKYVNEYYSTTEYKPPSHSLADRQKDGNK